MHDKTQKIWAIYKITNMINGKLYIGQTKEPDKRWNQHRRSAANAIQQIHHAINKYGAHNFTYEVIDFAITKPQANCIETSLMYYYDTFAINGKGYNIMKAGELGHKRKQRVVSIETKEKISNTLKGRRCCPRTEFKPGIKSYPQAGFQKGHNRNPKKLTPEQVEQIKLDPRPSRQIAKEYGLKDHGAILRIRRGEY